MFIDPATVKNIMDSHNITPRGVLHVGAHECEERGGYNTHWNVSDTNIVWVDANPKMTDANKRRGIPNCYTAVLDESVSEKEFKITNNGQSSSLLNFGSHATDYPHIVVTEVLKVTTETLSGFFTKNGLDPADYNVWNFDIQGSELHVLRGSAHLLKHADVIYSEVNTHAVYDGCGLLSELDELLSTHGLKRASLHMTNEGWGDAVYVRTEPDKHPYGTMTLAIPTMDRYDNFLAKNLPNYTALAAIDTILIGDENGNDSAKILETPTISTSNITLINNPERLGPFHNKLSLLQNSKTDWIALIDSDNTVTAEYFTTLHTYWDIHGPNTNAVYIPAGVLVTDIRKDFEGQSHSPLVPFANRHVDKSNWNTFLEESGVEYALNIGNCVFHRSAAKFIHGNFPRDILTECKIMNKLLVENGFELIFVPNMKYTHVTHDNAVSLQESDKMNAVITTYQWTI